MKNSDLQIQPTHIKLSEVALEGQDFVYTSESGEITGKLKDLLGTHKYKLSFHIQPQGGIYRLKGKVSTIVDALCARCGVDVTEPINCEFDELLMVDDSSDYKNGSQSKTHFSDEFSEDQPFCHFIESDSFDVGEFTHEIIAINEPIRPLGGPDCEIKCDNYDKAIKKGWVITDEEVANASKSNPFSVLKDMKLNS